MEPQVVLRVLDSWSGKSEEQSTSSNPCSGWSCIAFCTPLWGGSRYLPQILWDKLALIKCLKDSLEESSVTQFLCEGWCYLSLKEKYWLSSLTTYFLREYAILPFCITKCPYKNKVPIHFWQAFKTLAFRSWLVASALTVDNKCLKDIE